MARQLEYFPNLVTMFLTRSREKGDAPFLWAKHGGTWEPISWSEAARQVAAFADSLKRIGIEPGDRVMLVSENRPEWLIADLGIMAAGAAGVDDAGEVLSPDRLHALLERFQVGLAPDQFVPVMEVNRSGCLPGTDILDPDDVMAFRAEQHGGNQIPCKLLA